MVGVNTLSPDKISRLIIKVKTEDLLVFVRIED